MLHNFYNIKSVLGEMSHSIVKIIIIIMIIMNKDGIVIYYDD